MKASNLIPVVAMVLGMAFPLGIRIMKAHDPILIPWGWAINGFLSVFSSLLAIVLAMTVGFTWVLLIGAAIYFVGFSLMVTEEARPKSAGGPAAQRK